MTVLFLCIFRNYDTNAGFFQDCERIKSRVNERLVVAGIMMTMCDEKGQYSEMGS